MKILGTGKIGTINEIISRPGDFAYKVTVDGKIRNYQEKYLEAYIDEQQQIYDALERNQYGGADDFYLFQTWYRLKRPIEGNFYSYLGSRTLFNPFQFKPLAKFIASSSDERLFIADEVGVGKTIEAGIILTELIARGRLDNHSPLLVVCPNALGPKWVKEMKERFNLRFRLHDGKQLRNALISVRDSGKLIDDSLWVVVSLEMIRMKDIMSLLEEINGQRQTSIWSMVVIDEAHHMRNTGTESNNLGHLLSELSDMMLMLSATPLNLSDNDLFNQMNILNPALFPDKYTFSAMLSPAKSINRCRRLLSQNDVSNYEEIEALITDLQSGPLGGSISRHPGVISLQKRIRQKTILSAQEVVSYVRLLTSLSPLNNSFTRTLKREALDHRITREAIKVPVILSNKEKEFYQAVIQAVEDAYLARGGDPISLGFISNMPRRMLSSCLPAMRSYLEWCLEQDRELILKEETMREADDDSSTESRPLTPELRKEFSLLVSRAKELADIDSKYQQFLLLIKQLRSSLSNPRIMVFSFFVRTLKYLYRRLEQEGYKVDLIYGGIPVQGDAKSPGRFDIMGKFENGEIDILLSSEVGGEGLDFQYCQAIINYDLPYNPMRVEQRIGRIDRFGQQADKVMVASMYLADTLDEKIYNVLYERIRIVEDSVGELEPILGSKLLDIQQDIISGQLTTEQMEKRIRELEFAKAQAITEMQQFEKSRDELLGEEVFTEYFQNMGQDKQFVQPADAARLSAICLTSWTGCSYKLISEDRAEINLSKEVIQKVKEHTRKPGMEASIDELGPLIKKDHPLKVIFDGSQANNYNDHCFLPPCGYWTRFLLGQIENRAALQRIFNLTVETMDGLKAGNYLVPLFESVITGIRDEIDMNAVPVNIYSGQVLECDYRQLSRKIFGSNLESNSDFAPNEEYCFLIDMAAEVLEKQMENRVEILKAENQYRIDARIESIRKGSEVRIERHQNVIREHKQRMQEAGQNPNQEFIRLREAQINKEINQTELRINALNKAMHVTPATSLIGVVFLQVKGD